jgi:hypothetical protein
VFVFSRARADSTRPNQFNRITESVSKIFVSTLQTPSSPNYSGSTANRLPLAAAAVVVVASGDFG